MIAVIYRFYLKPKREAEFQKAWNLVASHFIKHRGAIGSTLHQTPDGMWVAYSKWPDQKTRDASWPNGEALPPEIQNAIALMKDCTNEKKKLPEICMKITDDLLFQNKF